LMFKAREISRMPLLFMDIFIIGCLACGGVFLFGWFFCGCCVCGVGVLFGWLFVFIVFLLLLCMCFMVVFIVLVRLCGVFVYKLF